METIPDEGSILPVILIWSDLLYSPCGARGDKEGGLNPTSFAEQQLVFRGEIDDFLDFFQGLPL